MIIRMIKSKSDGMPVNKYATEQRDKQFVNQDDTKEWG